MYNLDEITVAFDDQPLVADAGLLLPATLAFALEAVAASLSACIAGAPSSSHGAVSWSVWASRSVSISPA